MKSESGFSFAMASKPFSFSLGLARFHLAKMDPRLFSLVVELRDTNPRQEGLTSKAVRLTLHFGRGRGRIL